MRVKKTIGLEAIGVRQFGRKTADRLGFSKEEHALILMLALWPRSVTSQFGDDGKNRVLQMMADRPKDCTRLILAIRKERDQRRDCAITKFLLDPEADPPNWTLTDKEVAARVNPTKAKGSAIKRVESVKSIRKTLARKFPGFKGEK